MINWDIELQDAEKIKEIVKAVFNMNNKGYDAMNLTMDLTACHLNGCPLHLDELLAAKPSDFYHDINGIQENINRETGRLENGFAPRHTA